MASSDFNNVRLTAAGAALAGSHGKLRVIGEHFDYTFTADGGTRVLSSEWRKVFSRRLSAGAPVFEIAPDIPRIAAPIREPAPAAVVEPEAEQASPKSSKGGK
jgi:hypothetical protein